MKVVTPAPYANVIPNLQAYMSAYHQVYSSIVLFFVVCPGLQAASLLTEQPS